MTAGPVENELQFLYAADPNSKILYVTFILMLGLQRLTFATGDRGFWPWVCLVLTHVIESWFWWSLALQTNVIGTQTIDSFLMDVLTFKIDRPNNNYFLLLIVVPSFVVMFFLAGWAPPVLPVVEAQKKRD